MNKDDEDAFSKQVLTKLRKLQTLLAHRIQFTPDYDQVTEWLFRHVDVEEVFKKAFPDSSVPKNEVDVDGEPALDEKGAAAFLNVSVSFLQQDRSRKNTGKEVKTSGPKFVRVKQSIFYLKKDLLAWQVERSERSEQQQFKSIY